MFDFYIKIRETDESHRSLKRIMARV